MERHDEEVKHQQAVNAKLKTLQDNARASRVAKWGYSKTKSSYFWDGVNDINAFGGGFREGILSSIEGMMELVTDPVGSIAEMAKGVADIVTDPKGDAAWAVNKWISFKNETNAQRASMLGAFFGSMIGIEDGGAVADLAKDAKAANVAVKGGSYGKVRSMNVGGEVHHMPADSVTDIPYKKGPAIWMKKEDHSLTASHPKTGSKGVIYRATQRNLMESNQARKALAIEVRDVRGLFGSAYNQSLQQMISYAKTLDVFVKQEIKGNRYGYKL